MNLFDHAIRITPDLIECYSDSADYDYFVRLEDEKQMYKALELANNVLDKWGSIPDDLDEDEYNYFYNAGYVEVVADIFEKNNIQATFFVEMGE